MIRLHFTLVAVRLTLSASAPIAQINTGEISGVVRDTSGGVLPGPTVTARHDATGTVVERVTDGEGRFFLPGLRIGAWTVEARLTGLSPQIQKAVLDQFSIRLDHELTGSDRLLARVSTFDADETQPFGTSALQEPGAGIRPVADDPHAEPGREPQPHLRDLPFFANRRGFTGALLGGWRANAIFIAQSGAPFTVNLSVDRANVGAGPAQRPDQLRDPNLNGGERSPERWFDTSALALPAQFTFGIARRNSVVGPGYDNVDFALAKTWTVGAPQLEFRWEIFNLLNRANFDLPNRIFGNPNFGRIVSAKGPREMQLGLRFAF